MTRLGIIGCGDIVNLYKGFSSKLLRARGLEITALVDVNLENAKKMANYFSDPILSIYPSPLKVLEKLLAMS